VEQVPLVVEELAAQGGGTEARLRELWSSSSDESPARFRAALALLHFDPERSDSEPAVFLYEQLFIADPARLHVLRGALRSQRTVLVPRLWRAARDTNLDPGRRFRAACVLADYDPDSDRWQEVDADVAARLVREDPAAVRRWAALLAPVAVHLKRSLFAAYQDRSRPEEARLAAAALAEQHAQDARTLIDLIEEAQPSQFRHVVPKLLDSSDQVLPKLRERWTAVSRPAVREGNAAATARRRANVAAAILLLDGDADLWDLLRPVLGPDSAIRPHLIQILGPMGIDPHIVARRLAQEKEPSIRRALILALGEYPVEQLPQAWKEKQTREFATLFQEDPDPGIHSAAEWVLRHWGSTEAALAGTRERSPEGKKRWYVTRQGHTMAVFDQPEPGQFGSPATEPGRNSEEILARPFTPEPFAIATKETTLAQFLAFHPDPAQQPSSRPVTAIGFYDAARYCNWLSKQEGIPKSQWCYEALSGTGGFAPSRISVRGRGIGCQRKRNGSMPAGPGRAGAGSLGKRKNWFGTMPGTRTIQGDVWRPSLS
jgi:hypothetical protein